MRETFLMIIKVKYLHSDLTYISGMTFQRPPKNLFPHINDTSKSCQNPTFKEPWKLIKCLQQSKKHSFKKNRYISVRTENFAAF